MRLITFDFWFIRIPLLTSYKATFCKTEYQNWFHFWFCKTAMHDKLDISRINQCICLQVFPHLRIHNWIGAIVGSKPFKISLSQDVFDPIVCNSNQPKALVKELIRGYNQWHVKKSNGREVIVEQGGESIMFTDCAVSALLPNIVYASHTLQ